jgi:hypothetical protein
MYAWRYYPCGVARMASWLIGIIGIIYIVVAIDLYRTGKSYLALMFLGYAVAQVGIWLESGK